MDKGSLYTLTVNNENVHLVWANAVQSEWYYHDCFCPLDTTVAIMTGSKPVFEKVEVINFFKRSLKDAQRKWLLIVNDNHKIIGECVFMDMDKLGYAHFRMAIFNKNYRGLGIGKWALQKSMEYASDVLGLSKIELEVFGFNSTARRLYVSLGFYPVECIKENSEYDNQAYEKWIMVLDLPKKERV